VTWKNSVELVRRYSNRADLQERLAQAYLRASERGQAQGDHTITVSGRAPGSWRVRDRLKDEGEQQLIGEFLAGTSKQVLADRYTVSLSTVKRILKKHGVRRAN
jgi:DNA invertase Pin-like site-specific DNA recombinase